MVNRKGVPVLAAAAALLWAFLARSDRTLVCVQEAVGVFALLFYLYPIFLLVLGTGFYYSEKPLVLVRCGRRGRLARRVGTLAITAGCLTLFMAAGFAAAYRPGAGEPARLALGAELAVKLFCLFFLVGTGYTVALELLPRGGRMAAAGCAYLLPALDLWRLSVMGEGGLLARLCGLRGGLFQLATAVDVASLLALTGAAWLMWGAFAKRKDVW